MPSAIAVRGKIKDIFVSCASYNKTDGHNCDKENSLIAVQSK